mmetsp:Transcript_6377/g.13970  ORF Transcript_6377/g.13970 Transcript_6377/m.13970 type:complete len:129 (+) Transcript_6377:73-459(+)
MPAKQHQCPMSSGVSCQKAISVECYQSTATARTQTGNNAGQSWLSIKLHSGRRSGEVRATVQGDIDNGYTDRKQAIIQHAQHHLLLVIVFRLFCDSGYQDFSAIRPGKPTQSHELVAVLTTDNMQGAS